MANLNNFTGEFFKLRDYHHAAKAFASDAGYIKAPYKGSGFHVNISFNNVVARTNEIQTSDISVLVRGTDLPEVRYDTQTLNQYNRKRIINKSVQYQPIRLTFRDDIAQNVRSMWIAYNQYYSADSNYPGRAFYAYDDVYNDSPFTRRYGLDNKAIVPFINNVDIYSMGDKTYSKQCLVNPLISSANFTEHDYSDIGRTQELILTIEYETILYSRGGTDEIPNFGSNNVSNYDVNYSQLKSEASQFIFDFLRNKLPDTPIVSTVLTLLEMQQRTGDFTPGKVGQILNNYAAQNAEFEQTKQELEKAIATSNTPLFPDMNDSIESFGPTQQQFIVNSSNITSNDQNLSVTPILQETTDTSTSFANFRAINPTSTYPGVNIVPTSSTFDVQSAVNTLNSGEYSFNNWTSNNNRSTITVELNSSGNYASKINQASTTITKQAAEAAIVQDIKNQIATIPGNIPNTTIVVVNGNESIGTADLSLN